MNSIIFFRRLTCANRLLCLRASRSEIIWAVVFELGLSVGMVLVAPVESLLQFSIRMLLVLELCNYFLAWEGSLVGFSLFTLGVLMIGTGEGYLV